jgi:hypothetical protein
LGEGFIRRADVSSGPPPLAVLLRGGRGGEVRLKLYLSMALLAVSPPYNLPVIPAWSWAELLDLPDPEHNGARRVNEAIGWLVEHRLVVSDRRRGVSGAVRLLSQSGTGDPYARPAGGGRYVKLPLGVWRDGWIVRLSGAALGLLIILLDLQGGRTKPQWISPSVARARYDLSADTWTKGVRELRCLGIVSVSRVSQGGFLDYRRLRNAYWVNEQALQGQEGNKSTRRAGRRTAPRSRSSAKAQAATVTARS